MGVRETCLLEREGDRRQVSLPWNTGEIMEGECSSRQRLEMIAALSHELVIGIALRHPSGLAVLRHAVACLGQSHLCPSPDVTVHDPAELGGRRPRRQLSCPVFGSSLTRRQTKSPRRRLVRGG